MTGFNPRWKRRTALGLAGMALIWMATTAQAQLYIDVYPSQDNPDSETIWVFRGQESGGAESLAHYGSSIRSSQNYHARDSWRLVHWNAGITTVPNLYGVNKPTDELVPLSPLFSSTNNPKDIESVRIRRSGSPGSYSSFSTNSIWFNASVTNAPTIRIGGTSRPIGNRFMNDTANYDEIGIRITPPNLVYSSNAVSRWFGSGILNKPFSDFFDSDSSSWGVDWIRLDNEIGSPYFASRSSIGSVGIIFRRHGHP